MRRLFLLPLAIVLAGCGGGDGLKTAPVSGRVTLNGKPLADAAIVFSPVARRGGNNYPGPDSGARTDSDGRFTLMLTGKDVRGAVVGKHKVRITMIPDADSADDRPHHFKQLPKQYSGKDTKLEFEVPADGTKTANFELTEP
jgi:hypothetical protein